MVRTYAYNVKIDETVGLAVCHASAYSISAREWMITARTIAITVISTLFAREFQKSVTSIA